VKRRRGLWHRVEHAEDRTENGENQEVVLLKDTATTPVAPIAASSSSGPGK
jgi:hypothetical protein